MAEPDLFAWSVHARNERAAFNCLYRARLRFLESRGGFMNVWSDDWPVDRRHDQHGKWAPFEPLLFLNVFVSDQKNVKPFALDQLQQRAVFEPAPFHTYDGMHLMLGQGTRQLARYVFIEQNLQCWAWN